MPNKNEHLAELDTLMGEISELLRKSEMPLQKDGPEELTPPADNMDAAPAAPEGAPADGIGDNLPQEGEAGPEEGLDGMAGEDDAALADEIKGMSDEELDKLLQAFMAEKDSRSQGAGPAAPAGGAPAPAPMMGPAEKSMKEDYAKLGKSMSAIAAAVESLTKKVDSIKAPAAPKVVARAATANSHDGQTLHKSAPTTPAVKRLSKSQTITYLEGQLRKGNKAINSGVIADACIVKSEDDLHAFQDRLLAEHNIEMPKV